MQICDFLGKLLIRDFFRDFFFRKKWIIEKLSYQVKKISQNGNDCTTQIEIVIS